MSPMHIDIKSFDYWNFRFEIYQFKSLAEEINVSDAKEKVFVVLDGSVVVVDTSDNRNEFKENEGFNLKTNDKYMIRSSSDSCNLLTIKQKIK